MQQPSRAGPAPNLTAPRECRGEPKSRECRYCQIPFPAVRAEVSAAFRCSGASALALLVMLVAPVLGQQDGQKHEHEAMHTNDDLDLQGPDEGKWASDASLRQGMSELKKAFEPAHGAYRNGEFDAEQASGLADAIEEEINFIIANCRLPADADAELHKLLATALGAAKSLRESDDLHEGLHRLHRVLQAYPDYFQHPGWSES